jgi:ATP-dependent RNA helicase DeaD
MPAHGKGGYKANYGKGNYGKGKYRPPQRTQEAEPAATVDPNAAPVRFEDLAVSDAIKAAVEAMGFTEATPIQGATIPLLLEGRDIIGQAQTGTGKTAAFGIPLIEAARHGRRGLVLAPTRELAKQVQQELQSISKGSPVEAICIVGGASFKDQVRALQRHPKAIVVATPGRVVDHLSRKTMDLSDIGIFVLDEADEMLSMGFQDELDAIVAALPPVRQNVLFSATIAPAVERLAKSALTDPVTVRAAQGALPNIRQGFVELAGRDRVEAIGRILEAEDPKAALLFARTRARVDELVEVLKPLGAEALHGGMQQAVRESVMKRFRDGGTRLLVATDVAARGLDVESIGLVLHDDLPGDVDTYTHRIGRTGRAGRSGLSILMIGPGRVRSLWGLEHATGKLERYTVPGDAEIAAAKARRRVAELQAIEPSPAARHALRELLATGMDAAEIAARLIESSLAKAVELPAPTVPGTTGLALKVGKMDNINPGSIVGVLINVGGLRASDIGRIDILDKMCVAEVPTAEVDRLCDALAGVRLSGRGLLPRAAPDWRFKMAPR